MPKRPRSVFQFRIVLERTDPPIWRQIQVPETYSFWDLHVAVQDAMGWQDSHLHSFDLPDPKTGTPVTIGIPQEEFEDEIPMLPGWDVAIADFFPEPGIQAEYLYDFGDGWRHTVTLEGILLREKGKRYPRCLDGKRRCPPEDCGGVRGYQDFLEIIAHPDHEEYEDMLEWAGGSFDPEHFDARKVRFDDPEKRWRYAFGGEGLSEFGIES